VYALSATTSFGRVRKPEEVGIKTLSMALGNCVASCLFLPVSTALKGSPRRSQTTWILQVKPPRERPNACSPVFFSACSGLHSFHCGGINFPQTPVNKPLFIQFRCKNISILSKRPLRCHSRNRWNTVFS
jgi:hypothetical protein